MSNQDSEEQITLSSSAFDQFKEDDKPTNITNEISQVVRIKEQLKLFRIYDNKYINVNEKSSQGISSFVFKVSMLDPKPVRKRIVKFGPLLLGFVLLTLAWLAFSLKREGHPLLTSVYVYTAIAAFVAIGLILIVYVFKEYKDTVIFYSQHGRIPIVVLLFRIPNKSEFRRFVEGLTACINTQKSATYFSDTQMLAAELSEHRKLRDIGALTNREYEAAKNNIMKYH